MTSREQRIEELIELALNALKELGAKAAIITVDMGDAQHGMARVAMVYGGVTNERVAELTVNTTAKILSEFAKERDLELPKDFDTNVESMKREAIAQMRQQAKRGEMEHLSPYIAHTKLVKPL
jgi:hypothetical protein